MPIERFFDEGDIKIDRKVKPHTEEIGSIYRSSLKGHFYFCSTASF